MNEENKSQSQEGSQSTQSPSSSAKAAKARKSPPKWFVGTMKIYMLIAFLLLTSIILLVIVNGVCGLFVKPQDPIATAKVNPLVEKYGMETMKQAYPNMSESEMMLLLNESWYRGFAFETFTQFKEREFHGKYYNVSAGGFRESKDQGPWPMSAEYYNIFVFGGSTTFGYGVADWQTIPSHLQQSLPELAGRKVRVYNFGRGYYYSSQERILFQELLVGGAKPDMAIFVDGLNDCAWGAGAAHMSKQFGEFFARDGKAAAPMKEWVDALPITQAAQRFSKWFRSRVKPKKPKPIVAAEQGGATTRPETYQPMIDRYFANKKLIEAIGGVYGVRTVFVWQPSPGYKYNSPKNPFWASAQVQQEYVAMATYCAKNQQGPNFVYLADIQEGTERPMYVDNVHYGDDLCRMIARQIANAITVRQLAGK